LRGLRASSGNLHKAAKGLPRKCQGRAIILCARGFAPGGRGFTLTSLTFRDFIMRRLLPALSAALLLLGPAALARDITGEVSYRARVALPDGAELVVQLSDATGTVAELRQGTLGRQVPLQFLLTTDADQALMLRAALIAGGVTVWGSDPMPVPAGGNVSLGPVEVHRHIAIGQASRMMCGKTRIDVALHGDTLRLRVAGGSFDLTPEPAASGARYSDGQTPPTTYWSRGNRARVTLRGQDLPECLADITPPLLPLAARGNEPGWIATLSRDGMTLSTEAGANLAIPLPAPQPLDHGLRFASQSLTITLNDRLCRDTMTGMPYPQGVTVVADDTTLTGCGGDPARLLDGDWSTDLGTGTVTFRLQAGRVMGQVCNRFSGSFALTTEGITFGPVVASKMACAAPLMQTEQALFAALSHTTRFDIADDGALVLLADDIPLLTARR
jgi:uncharacterized membrane protein